MSKSGVDKLCTPERKIRETSFSDTYRAKLKLGGVLKAWDITHIAIPFSSDKEERLLKRHQLTQGELSAFYRDFDVSVQQEIALLKELHTAESEQLAVNLVKYLYVDRDAHDDGSVDYFIITDTMDSIVGSEFIANGTTNLLNMLQISARFTQILKLFQGTGIHIGAFDLDTVYLTTVNDKRMMKLGSLLYAEKAGQSRDLPLALMPGTAHPSVLEGGAQSVGTDMYAVFSMLWSVLGGNHYNDRPDFDVYPQHAPEQMKPLFEKGLSMGDEQTLKEVHSETYALIKKIRRGEMENTEVHFTPHSVDDDAKKALDGQFSEPEHATKEAVQPSADGDTSGDGGAAGKEERNAAADPTQAPGGSWTIQEKEAGASGDAAADLPDGSQPDDMDNDSEREIVTSKGTAAEGETVPASSAVEDGIEGAGMQKTEASADENKFVFEETVFVIPNGGGQEKQESEQNQEADQQQAPAADQGEGSSMPDKGLEQTDSLDEESPGAALPAKGKSQKQPTEREKIPWPEPRDVAEAPNRREEISGAASKSRRQPSRKRRLAIVIGVVAIVCIALLAANLISPYTYQGDLSADSTRPIVNEPDTPVTTPVLQPPSEEVIENEEYEQMPKQDAPPSITDEKPETPPVTQKPDDQDEEEPDNQDVGVPASPPAQPVVQPSPEPVQPSATPSPDANPSPAPGPVPAEPTEEDPEETPDDFFVTPATVILQVGQTVQLKPSDTCTWSSSDPDIAYVSSNGLNGIGAGACTISARQSSTGKTVKIAVTVQD